MNLKISTIIKSGIGIILFVFSLFCFALNYYLTIPIGIISVFVSFLISPLFEIICKKINKKFTLLQKLTLLYGTIMIVYIITLIDSLSVYDYNNIEKSVYFLINLLLILVYWSFFIIFNKNKYDKDIKVSLKKRIILIIITIVIMNLPINIIKMYFLDIYYKQINYINSYKILETKYISSYNLENNIKKFDKLLFRNDFEGYETTNYSEETLIYSKDNLGILINKDILDGMSQEESKEWKVSLQLFKLYDISSTGEFYEFYNNHKKLTIFDNAYEIVFTSLNYIILTNTQAESYQKLILDNNLKIYIIRANNSKNIELLIKNEESAYTISFLAKDEKISEDYIMDFIKTLSIE